MSEKESSIATKETLVPIKNGKVSESKSITMKQWSQIGALCLAVFCQTYLFLNAFTYSGFMAMHLIPGLTTQTAGSRAGLISSAYMIGRTFSAFAWGKIADTIGRKFVFYCGFFIPAVFSVWFGLATSFNTALFARFMMGVGNGLILAAKTTVSELAKGNEAFEAKGMGLVMGMWGWGFLICPAISGLLSDPVLQYPDLPIVQRFQPTFSKYPFLLPNLVSVILCLVGTLVVYLVIEETLPEAKRKTVGQVWNSFVQDLKAKFSKGNESKEELLPLRDSMQEKTNYNNSSKQSLDDTSTEENSSKATDEESEDGLMPHAESSTMLSTSIGYDSHKAVLSPSRPQSPVLHKNVSKSLEKQEAHPTIASFWAQPKVRYHIVGFWIIAFTQIVLDEAFPLFCIADHGGLNITETGIGKILSGAGLIFVLCQYTVYTALVKKFGIYMSQLVGISFGSPIVIFIPFSLYLNRGQTEANQLTWSAYVFLCVILAARYIGGNIVVSSLTIATNRTVPANHRATMNGLVMLGGSLAKALGPVCAGFLSSLFLGGSILPPTYGAVVMFAIFSSLGLSCMAYIAFVLGKFHKTV